jgi:hypothetical protein
MSADIDRGRPYSLSDGPAQITTEVWCTSAYPVAYLHRSTGAASLWLAASRSLHFTTERERDALPGRAAPRAARPLFP